MSTFLQNLLGFGIADHVRDAVLEHVRHLEREKGAAELDLQTLGAVPAIAPVLEPIAPSKEASPTRVAAVLRRAQLEWERGVKEPPGNSHHQIDVYIRSVEGLHWPSAALPNSHDTMRYTRNGQFAWCGAFAAYCFALAGLRADIRKRSCASTFRLFTLANQTPRYISPRDIEAGDIAIVGPPNGKRYGAHVTICRETPAPGATFIMTYEGNAKGEGPTGAFYEGVVRQSRPFSHKDPAKYCVLYGVRFLDADYEQ